MASTRKQKEKSPAMHQILSISKTRQSKVSLEPGGIIIQDKIHVPEKLGSHESYHVTTVVDPETLIMQRYIIPLLSAYEIRNVTLNPKLTQLALIYKRPQESKEGINIHDLTSTEAHSAKIVFFPTDPVLYSAWINESILAVVTLKAIYHYDVNKEISSCLSDSYQYDSHEKYKVIDNTGLNIKVVLNYEVAFNGQYALLKVKEGSSEGHVYCLISLEHCKFQKLDKNIKECHFEQASGDQLWIAAISHKNNPSLEFHNIAVDSLHISFKLGKTLTFSHVLKDECQMALAKATLEAKYYISLEDTHAIYQFSSDCKISHIADVGVSDLQVNPVSGYLTGLQVNPNIFCVFSNHITKQVPSQPRHIPVFDPGMLEFIEMFYSRANMSGHISIREEPVPVNCLSRELFLRVDDYRLNIPDRLNLRTLLSMILKTDIFPGVPDNAYLVSVEQFDLQPLEKHFKIAIRLEDYTIENMITVMDLKDNVFTLEGIHHEDMSLQLCGTLTIFSFPAMAYTATFYNQNRNMIMNVKVHASEILLENITKQLGYGSSVFPDVTIRSVECKMLLSTQDTKLDLDAELESIKLPFTDLLQLVDVKMKLMFDASDGTDDEIVWCGSIVTGFLELCGYKLALFSIPMCSHQDNTHCKVRKTAVEQAQWVLSVPGSLDDTAEMCGAKLQSPICLEDLLSIRIPNFSLVISHFMCTIAWNDFIEPVKMDMRLQLQQIQLGRAILFENVNISCSLTKIDDRVSTQDPVRQMLTDVWLSMTLIIGNPAVAAIRLEDCMVALPTVQKPFMELTIPGKATNLTIRDVILVLTELTGVCPDIKRSNIPEILQFKKLALTMQWILPSTLKHLRLEIQAEVTWLNIIDIFKLNGLCLKVLKQEGEDAQVTCLAQFEILGFIFIVRGNQDLSQFDLLLMQEKSQLLNKPSGELSVNDLLSKLLNATDIPSFLNGSIQDVSYASISVAKKTLQIQLSLPDFNDNVDVLSLKLSNTKLTIQGEYPNTLSVSICGSIAVLNLPPVEYSGSVSSENGKFCVKIHGKSLGEFSLGTVLETICEVLRIPNSLNNAPVLDNVVFTHASVDVCWNGDHFNFSLILKIISIKLPFTNSLHLREVEAKIMYKKDAAGSSWEDSQIAGLLYLGNRKMGQFHIPLYLTDGSKQWQLSVPEPFNVDSILTKSTLAEEINLHQFAEKLFRVPVPDLGLVITTFAFQVKWKLFSNPDELDCVLGIKRLELVPKPVPLCLNNVLLVMRYNGGATDEDQLLQAFGNSKIQFDLCLGNEGRRRLELHKCQMKIPQEKESKFQVLIPNQKIEFGFQDMVDLFTQIFTSTPELREIGLPIDLRFSLIALDLVWNTEKEIQTFHLETLADLCPEMNILEIFKIKNVGLHVVKSSDGKYDWNLFCYMELFTVPALMSIDLRKKKFVLIAGESSKLIDSTPKSLAFQDLYQELIPSSEFDLSDLYQNADAVQLNSPTTRLEISLEQGELLICGKVKAWSVGLLARKQQTVEVILSIHYTQRVKWQKVCKELSFLDQLKFLPVSKDVIVTAISKHNSETTLSQSILHLEEEFNHKIIAEQFSQTEINPPAVIVSATVIMPDEFPYNILGLSGKSFNAAVLVNKGGPNLKIPLPDICLGDVRFDNSCVKLTRSKIDISIGLTVELPVSMDCTKMHQAVIGGSLVINSKAQILTANFVFKGEGKEPAWPKPFGLNSITVKRVELGIVLSKKSPSLKFRAAGSLLNQNIDIMLQLSGTVPRAGYLKLQNVSFINLLTIFMGSSELKDLEWLDFLLPKLKHLFLLILLPGTSVTDISFPENEVGRLKNSSTGERQLTTMSLDGPCFKFDICAEWFGIKASLFGGMSQHPAKIEFMGKLDEPLNILGILTLKGVNGELPSMFFDMDLSKYSVEFKMIGKVKFFFFELEAEVDISTVEKKFRLRVELKLFGVKFHGDIGFGLQNGSPFLDLELSLHDLKLSTMVEGIRNAASKHLKSLEQKMDEALEEIERKKKSGNFFKRLFWNICSWVVSAARAVVHCSRKGIEWITVCVEQLAKALVDNMFSIKSFDIGANTRTRGALTLGCNYDMMLAGHHLCGEFEVTLNGNSSSGCVADSANTHLAMQYTHKESQAQGGDMPTGGAQPGDSDVIKRLCGRADQLAIRLIEIKDRIPETKVDRPFTIEIKDRIPETKVDRPFTETKPDNLRTFLEMFLGTNPQFRKIIEPIQSFIGSSVLKINNVTKIFNRQEVEVHGHIQNATVEYHFGTKLLVEGFSINIDDRNCICNLSGYIVLEQRDHHSTLQWKVSSGNDSTATELCIEKSNGLAVSMHELLSRSKHLHGKQRDWVFQEFFMQDVSFGRVLFKCHATRNRLNNIHWDLCESGRYTLLKKDCRMLLTDMEMTIKMQIDGSTTWDLRGQLQFSPSQSFPFHFCDSLNDKCEIVGKGPVKLRESLQHVLASSDSENIPLNISTGRIKIKVTADNTHGINCVMVSMEEDSSEWNDAYGLGCVLKNISGHILLRKGEVPSAELKANLFLQPKYREKFCVKMTLPDAQTGTLLNWQLNTAQETQILSVLFSQQGCSIDAVKAHGLLEGLSLQLNNNKHSQLHASLKGNWAILPLLTLTQVEAEIHKTGQVKQTRYKGFCRFLDDLNVPFTASVGSLHFDIPIFKYTTDVHAILSRVFKDIQEETKQLDWLNNRQHLSVEVKKLSFQSMSMESHILFHMDDWVIWGEALEMKSVMGILTAKNYRNWTFTLQGRLCLFGIAFPVVSMGLPSDRLLLMQEKSQLLNKPSGELSVKDLLSKLLNATDIPSFLNGSIQDVSYASVSLAKKTMQIQLSLPDFNDNVDVLSLKLSNTKLTIQGGYQKTLSVSISGSIAVLNLPLVEYTGSISSQNGKCCVEINGKSLGQFSVRAVLVKFCEVLRIPSSLKDALGFDNIAFTRGAFDVCWNGVNFNFSLILNNTSMILPFPNTRHLSEFETKIMYKKDAAGGSWKYSQITGLLRQGNRQMGQFSIPLSLTGGRKQ